MAALTWVPYRGSSPTVAANGVATEIGKLIKAGEKRELANFGQGREQISVHLAIQNKIIKHFSDATLDKGLFNAGYNARANMGGTQEHRDIARAWLNRFIGVDGETFVLGNVGRIALNETFKKYKGSHALVVPYERWPMIDDIANDYGIPIVRTYQHTRAPLGDTIAAATRGSRYLRESQIWYIGTPSNPRGLITTEADMDSLIAVLEEGIKQDQESKPVLVFDIPYFHAAEQRDIAGKPILNMGLTPEFFEKLRALGVPYIASISFSKALGMATPGFSFMTVSPDIADDMRGQLVRSGIGGSYSPNYYDAVLNFFRTQHDPELRAHFKTLRANYVTNCEVLARELDGVAPVLKAAFGPRAQYGLLLDGDPAMTRLIELPKKGIHGRTVPIPVEFELDGNQLKLEGTSDFLSYMANVYGVVMVDNGCNRKGDTLLIRVATAEPAEKFARGSARLAQGLVTVARAPK